MLPIDHQQLRDPKSRCIWLRRTYMFWEHIFHYLVRRDYSHQQCQPPLFRNRQKLCRILGYFRLIRYKQPFLFCDISEFMLSQPLVFRHVELYRPTRSYLSSLECLVSS